MKIAFTRTVIASRTSVNRLGDQTYHSLPSWIDGSTTSAKTRGEITVTAEDGRHRAVSMPQAPDQTSLIQAYGRGFLLCQKLKEFEMQTNFVT